MMLTAETEIELDRRMSLAKSAWERIAAHLERERIRIQEEIKSTPMPIPACDVNINYLLERRARIGEELDRLRQAQRADEVSEDSIARIEAFLGSSNCLDDRAKLAIREWLRESLAPAAPARR